MEWLGAVCLVAIGATLALAVWNACSWPAIAASSAPALGRVSVLVPARDEEQRVGGCLDSVLAQGATVHEVCVYDDRSSDGTAAVVRERATRDPRVRLLEGRALPAGWCGKTHACARLAEAATGDWLLFLDADAKLLPDAVSRLAASANTWRVSFLSAWPGLDMGSMSERTLMPLLNVLVFSLFPAPLSLRRMDPSLGLAHGACLFVERAAYVRVGGHAAVRDEIFEDSRLAQVWRSRGERGVCLDGQHAVRVRMYASLGEIWRGFQKNFFPAFRRARSFWLFLAWHLFVFVLPVVLFLVRRDLVSVLALTGLLAVRAVLAWRFSHPWWSMFFHPFAETVLVGIALASWWRCRSGRGVEWKGRTYRATPTGA